MKNPLTLAGIEPATFRIVAQHLNHCATAVRLLLHISVEKKNMLAWLFRYHASTGSVKWYRTVSVNSVLILAGIMEVRYVLKIQAKKNSYSGRGFLWFFLSLQTSVCIVPQTCLLIPPPTHFPFHYPQC